MWTRRLIATAAIACATALPVAAQTDLDGTFPADAGVTFDAMHQAVSSDFNDPMSAQYKGMGVQDPLMNGNPVICGWVNAKNAMGGYTPFVPFSFKVSNARVATYEGWDSEATGKLVLIALASSGCSARALGL